MVPTPTAFGLTVCEKIIIEEGTRRVTLVSGLTKLLVQRFPSPPQAFAVFAALTDGKGDATIQVVVRRVDTLEEVHSQSRTIHFPDRLMEVQVLFHVQRCVFPAAGRYEVLLLADREWVAHRRLRVLSSEA